MRIGILGGTFNPIHNGHLHVARQALKKLCLDKVVFVPAKIPPHKKICGFATIEDRLRMLRLAICGEKRFAISLYEIRQWGKSYSIRTVRYLRKRYGKGATLFFLLGADSIGGLKKWRDIESLSELVEFVVFTRPGFAIDGGFPKVLRVDIPGKDVSSTRIRRLAGKGGHLGRLVPKKVKAYIENAGLYK
ncbi:MAG: nicotinate (nicotinamide) nucleotide adenylyltransferase [Omnitrophica bacterium RBG_13_46_9]|nr:MAG: nicotinate (nicotinamide) nucleotide adenylyltransferase [Omnitrophica bacterium RBG_13_46_9]